MGGIELADLPEFNAHGVLPVGVFPTTPPVFCDRFVTAIPEHTNRERLFDGLTRLRGDLDQTGVVATQWLDGSFVERREDPPHDIDCVCFVDAMAYESLDDKSRSFIESQCTPVAAHNTYGTHCHWAPYYPDNHPRRAVHDYWRRYWRKHFGYRRDRVIAPNVVFPGLPKGLVSMPIGSAGRAPVVDTAAVIV
jgi:hypothetical protein